MESRPYTRITDDGCAGPIMLRKPGADSIKTNLLERLTAICGGSRPPITFLFSGLKASGSQEAFERLGYEPNMALVSFESQSDLKEALRQHSVQARVQTFGGDKRGKMRTSIVQSVTEHASLQFFSNFEEKNDIEFKYTPTDQDEHKTITFTGQYNPLYQVVPQTKIPIIMYFQPYSKRSMTAKEIWSMISRSDTKGIGSGGLKKSVPQVDGDLVTLCSHCTSDVEYKEGKGPGSGGDSSVRPCVWHSW